MSLVISQTLHITKILQRIGEKSDIQPETAIRPILFLGLLAIINKSAIFKEVAAAGPAAVVQIPLFAESVFDQEVRRWFVGLGRRGRRIEESVSSMRINPEASILIQPISLFRHTPTRLKKDGTHAKADGTATITNLCL
jgi:hypothetical protein